MINKQSTDFGILKHVQRLWLTSSANSPSNDPCPTPKHRDPSFSFQVPIWLLDLIATKCTGNLKELHATEAQLTTPGSADSVSAILKRLEKLKILTWIWGRIVDTTNFGSNNLTELHIVSTYGGSVDEPFVACFPNLRRVTLPIYASGLEILQNHLHLERINLLQWFRKPSRRRAYTLAVLVTAHSQLQSAQRLRYNLFAGEESIFRFRPASLSAILPASIPISPEVVIETLKRGNIEKVITMYQSGRFGHLLPTWNEIKQKIEPQDALLGMARSRWDDERLDHYIQSLEPELSQRLSQLVARKDRRANVLWKLPSLAFHCLDALESRGFVRLENVLSERNGAGLSLGHVLDRDHLVKTAKELLGEDLFTQLHTIPEPDHFHMPKPIRLPLIHFWETRNQHAAISIMESVQPEAYPIACLALSLQTLRVALGCSTQLPQHQWTERLVQATDAHVFNAAIIAQIIRDLFSQKDDVFPQGELSFGADPSEHLSAIIEAIQKSNFVPNLVAVEDEFHVKAIKDHQLSQRIEFQVNNLALVLRHFQHAILLQFQCYIRSDPTSKSRLARLLFDTATMEHANARVPKEFQNLSTICVNAMKSMCTIAAQCDVQQRNCEPEDAGNFDEYTPSSQYLAYFSQSALARNHSDPFLEKLEWLVRTEFSIVEDDGRRSLRRAHLLNAVRKLVGHYVYPLEKIIEVCLPYLTLNEILAQDSKGLDLPRLIEMSPAPNCQKIADYVRGEIARLQTQPGQGPVTPPT